MVDTANQPIAQHLFQALLGTEAAVQCEFSKGSDVVGDSLGRLPRTRVEVEAMHDDGLLLFVVGLQESNQRVVSNTVRVQLALGDQASQ